MAALEGHGSRPALRIALVTPVFPPDIGGVETHVSRLAAGLAERGQTVSVLTRGHATKDEYCGGYTVHRCKARSHHYALMPDLWRALRRRASQFDVVHAHSYHAVAALAAATFSNAPLVFTPHYHGTGHTALRRILHVLYRPLGKQIFARSAAVICVSRAEAALVMERFPSTAERITVIPNGAEATEIRAAEPKVSRARLILSSARLEPYKNVDRTIDALAELDPSFVLHVTGDGEARLALERHVEKRRLGERVRFLGRVSREEYLGWLRAASCFVTMSTKEAQGIVVVEALCAGAPVVASDIPAHREVAEQVGAGVVLVSPTSPPKSVAHAIETAIAQGRPPADFQPPSWSDVVSRTLELYRSVARVD